MTLCVTFGFCGKYRGIVQPSNHGPQKVDEIQLSFSKERAEIQPNLKRFAEKQLSEWRDRPGRKPLLLRGARQVGKTYLVENWGAAHFEAVVTVDLERERDLHSLFSQSDPKRLLDELALVKGRRVLPVEVKAGRTGTLRSTFQFLREKRRTRAVRFHTGSLALEEVKLPGDEGTRVQLLSVPLYAVGQLDRLLRAVFL